MDKFVKNTANVIEFDIGVVATGTPTIAIVDGAGDEHLAATATTNPSEGVYRLLLTPAQVGSVLDTYTATLSAVINAATNLFEMQYEVAGGTYFAVDEALEMPGMSAIATQSIVDARERIEELIEAKLGRVFVPRGRRTTIGGSGSYDLQVGDWFIRTIRSVSTRLGTVDTAYTAPQVADLIFGSRVLSRKDGTVFPYGHRNITIHYEYGMDQPPEPVKRAALLMCQASFILTDSEGNPTRPLDSVLTEIPEVKELLAPYGSRNGVYSIQIGTG